MKSIIAINYLIDKKLRWNQIEALEKEYRCNQLQIESLDQRQAEIATEIENILKKSQADVETHDLRAYEQESGDFSDSKPNKL